VVQNKNAPVLQFWFDKVPLLDAVIVLPALTVSMISGTGLTIKRYGGLALAPTHIPIVFYTLIALSQSGGHRPILRLKASLSPL
jgi:hypothetical protein